MWSLPAKDTAMIVPCVTVKHRLCSFFVEPRAARVTLRAVTENDYREITNDPSTLPGPRAFLVSGYGAEALDTLHTFLATLGYGGVPVKPCTAAQIDETIAEVLAHDTVGPPAGEGALPNVMVFSGMTRQDVGAVMDQFAQSGLKRPIFATTTPTNLGFTVKTLLLHLLEEEKAVRAQAKKQRR